MKKLFLTSSFKDVASLFEDFAGEQIKGKTVTFIPTAGNVEKMVFYIGAARKSFEKLGVIVDELDISVARAEEVADKLKRNDYIYVSGGNTFYLLQELKKSGANKIIAEQIALGKLYIGESAGSMVVSPNIEYAKKMDDSAKAPELEEYTALNIVNFYPLPHHTNFPFAKTVEKIIAEYGSKQNLYPISNKQAILVAGDDVKVISK